MGRKIIGYIPNSTTKYIISPAEQNIMSLHPKSLGNGISQMGEYGGLVIQNNNGAVYKGNSLSESAFLSDARMDEIKEMVKSL